MNKAIITEIVLSLIGFSLLAAGLNYFSDSESDSQNLTSSMYSVGYLNANSQTGIKIPAYKQSSSHRQRNSESSNTSFPTGNAFQSTGLFEEAHPTNVNISKQKNPVNNKNGYRVQQAIEHKKDSPINGFVALNHQLSVRGKSSQTESMGTYRNTISKGFLTQESFFNKPFFANASSDDVILTDPMTDPDEENRIPVGGSPLLMIFFAAIYIVIKTKFKIFIKS